MIFPPRTSTPRRTRQPYNGPLETTRFTVRPDSLYIDVDETGSHAEFSGNGDMHHRRRDPGNFGTGGDTYRRENYIGRIGIREEDGEPVLNLNLSTPQQVEVTRPAELADAVCFSDEDLIRQLIAHETESALEGAVNG